MYIFQPQGHDFIMGENVFVSLELPGLATVSFFREQIKTRHDVQIRKVKGTWSSVCVFLTSPLRKTLPATKLLLILSFVLLSNSCQFEVEYN